VHLDWKALVEEEPTQSANDIKVYRNGGVGYLSKSELTKEKHMVDKWKVFIPRAGSGSDSFPHSILGKPFVGEPGSISSWTYMYIGPFSSKKETENVISYISSRLFRFLVLLHKPSQDATKSVYTFVPTQDFSENWTDEKLYKKYGITQSEIEFINNMIKPMGESDE
jgi:site-specific DNA-methyltransferase (adenine-specific)